MDAVIGTRLRVKVLQGPGLSKNANCGCNLLDVNHCTLPNPDVMMLLARSQAK